MKRVKFLFIFVVFLCIGGLSRSDFRSPNRSVYAENNNSSSIPATSTDFGFFNERAIVSWVNIGDGVVAPDWAEGYKHDDYFASAYLDSTITSNHIIANGFTEEWNPFYHTLLENYTQSASSTFSINLVIDTPSWISLFGTLNAWGDYGGTEFGRYITEVNLSSQSGEIFSARIDTYDNFDGRQMQIDESFFLDTGIYSFYMKADSIGWYSPYWPYGYDGQAWGVGGGGYAYFDMELIPEPATAILLAIGAFSLRQKRP